jgi:hypothetical protein
MQYELGQRIEPLDFGRQKFVYRIRGAARFAHVMSVVPFVLSRYFARWVIRLRETGTP